jgi:hypothetical protein
MPTIAANTTLQLVNTTSSAKSFVLPSIASNRGRLLIFKDIAGTFATNNVTLTPTSPDTFENTLTTLTLSTNYGAWTFLNDGVSIWFITDYYDNSLTLSGPTSYSEGSTIPFPTTTTNLVVNTKTASKLILLPTVSTVPPGSILTVKDKDGSALNSTITVYTKTGNLFENKSNMNTVVINTNYGAVQFASDGSQSWYILQRYVPVYAQIGVPVVVLGLFGMSPWGSSAYPDPTAYWIWNDANAPSSVVANVNIRFNQVITVIVSTPVYIYFMIDNYGTIYLNGDALVTTGGGWGSAGLQVSATLIPGTNFLNFDCLNQGDGPNPAGLIASIVRVSDSVILSHTDSSWVYY